MAQSCSTKELAIKITSALEPNTIQATSKRRFLLKSSSFSAASSIMSAGIDIEGVHLTPMVAFDKLTSVFVSHIPPLGGSYWSSHCRFVCSPVSFLGLASFRWQYPSPCPLFFRLWVFLAWFTIAASHFSAFGAVNWGFVIGNALRSKFHRLAGTAKHILFLLHLLVRSPPPPLVIVECRPDGVAVSSSQQLSGGSAVFVPPASEVEAMDAGGPTIDSPAIPSSSAPGGDNERRSCSKDFVWLSLFLFVTAFADSDGFLRVEGAIPSLFVH